MGQAKAPQPVAGSCSALFGSPTVQVCWDLHFCFSSDLLTRLVVRAFPTLGDQEMPSHKPHCSGRKVNGDKGVTMIAIYVGVFAVVLTSLLSREGHDVCFQLENYMLQTLLTHQYSSLSPFPFL